VCLQCAWLHSRLRCSLALFACSPLPMLRFGRPAPQFCTSSVKMWQWLACGTVRRIPGRSVVILWVRWGVEAGWGLLPLLREGTEGLGWWEGEEGAQQQTVGLWLHCG